MNSEKVKEIKKALECCANVKEKCDNKKCYLFDKLEHPYCERQLKKDFLTLINELQSKNDTLHTNLCEYRKENKQLKDRIAELEKENGNKTDTITDLLKKQEFYETKKLKQFAERLKEKLFDLGNIVNENDIDETLKEYIKS